MSRKKGWDEARTATEDMAWHVKWLLGEYYKGHGFVKAGMET